MAPLIQALIPIIGKVIEERVKTKSTVVGAPIVAASIAGLTSGSDMMGLQPGSPEHYANMIVMGIFGIVGFIQVIKKEIK